MAQTRLKSGNLHMVGGDNGSSGNVLKSKGDGTFEWGPAIDPPTFSSVDYPGDDTALDPAGGQSLVINGTTFNVGVTVTIDGTTPSSITRNSATQLTVTTPVKSAGTYDLIINNTNGGTATASNAVSYNGVPTFTNAAGSLGTVTEGATVSLSAAATEPDGGAITYAITSGALPSGLSINANTGAITGTAPSVSASTTSNFTVTATDNENQSTARAYSITVNPPLPSDNFKAVLYTGNGSTQSITGIGFKPDFVWIKQRNATNHSRLLDTTRGATKILYSSLNYAEDTESTGLTSFDSDGFTLGSQQSVNDNGDTYVAWCWKANGGTTSSNSDGSVTSTVQANTALGFSIVKWDGTGSTSTIGHGLGVVPELILIKGTDSSGDWQVYSSPTGNGNKLSLNSSAAASSTSRFNSTSPTTSVFSYNNSGVGTGQIAYAFHSVSGFSKIGKYTGNGSDYGPIVETGFEPAFIMIKEVDQANHWNIYDNKRTTTNPRDKQLQANLADAESTNTSIQVDFLSNGFQCKGSGGGLNRNNSTFIYMAFAADADTTAPTLANSFASVEYTGNGATGRSFTGMTSPNLIWNKQINGTTSHVLTDTVRGIDKYLVSSSNNEQQSSSYYTSFNSDGWTFNNNALNVSGETFLNWGWKADDNEPTIIPATGKRVSIPHGATNFFAINAVSGSTGKYYFEVKVLSHQTTCTAMIGLYTNGYADDWQNARSRSYYGSNGNKYQGSSSSSYGATYTTNDVIGVAVNGDDDEVTFYKNGTSQGLAFSGNTGDSSFGIQLSTGLYAWTGEIYFTSSEWVHSAPSGFTEWTAAKNDYDAGNITVSGAGFDYDNLESIVSTNANAGFSIVRYAGSNFASKIKHNLGGTPDMIIIKRTNGGAGFNWIVGHTGMSYTSNYTLTLDGGSYATWNYFNATAPTSTVFELGTGSNTSSTNASGGQYIAYCWRSITGYSKFGSYTSNAGTKITTGFEPTLMMFHYKANGDWYIQDLNDWDGSTYGANGGKLIKKYYTANGNSIPTPVPTGGVEVMSDGFYPTNWFNTTAGTIYAAWKEN